ncbi:MAG: AAA family ATPase [Chitinophagales bacterium]
MKLVVQNFGPIRSGEIDLSKRFYVFVGKNNSGKTYMAHLMWALFHTEYRATAILKLLFRDKLRDTLQGQFDNNQLEITTELIESILATFADLLVSDSLAQMMNVPKNHFILQKTRIEFAIEGVWKRIEEKKYPKHIDPLLFNDKLYGSVSYHKPADSSIIYIEKKLESKVDSAKAQENLNNNIEIFIFHYLMNIIFDDVIFISPFYLPANRLFFPSFYAYIIKIERDKQKELFRKAYENDDKDASDALLEWLSFVPYTLPSYQLIDALLSKIGTNTNGIAKAHQTYLNQLESILGGKITIERREGIAPPKFNLEMKRGKESLAIHLASSSVNQLTTLYLYFKYWAKQKGNLLILDEPEENLSIENQVKITDLLIEFATKNNNRVLITTHSPSIAENTNNHIYLDLLRNESGKDVDAIIEENGLDIRSDIALPKEQVGAYYFDGKRIMDYQDEYNYGIYFKNFVQSQDNIRRISNVLTDHIYTSKEAESE